MAENRKIKGNLGEKAVKKYITEKGYKVIAENYCIRGGEIDIIAEDGGFLVFIEVKTRKRKLIESAYESVDKRKIMNIVRTAVRYCTEHNTELQPRFDVAVVCMDDMRRAYIDYIENAFDLSDCDIIF